MDPPVQLSIPVTVRVPLPVSVPPRVRLAIVRLVPDRSAVLPDGIVTASVSPGTPLGSQFASTSQSLDIVPSKVLGAAMAGAARHRLQAKISAQSNDARAQWLRTRDTSYNMAFPF